MNNSRLFINMTTNSGLRGSSSLTESCIAQLQKLLGGKKVLTSESIRTQFAKDEGHFRRATPSVVVQPTSVEEVSAILRICNESRVPVVPFGTGTGLEGGSIPLTEGVTLSLSELAGGVLRVNEEDSDCTVRPSVTRQQLNDHVRHTGLFFPVDPGAEASLCGMVATGASGTNAVRYGTMKENVLNLEVVLADGTVVHTRGEGRRPRKSAAGYNLTELFVGSEGTLGIVTAATLRLHPRPASLAAAVSAFPTVKNAVDSVVQTLQSAISIARIEFLDDSQVAACNKYSKLDLLVKPTLFLEFHGTSEAEVMAQANIVREICESNGSDNFTMSSDHTEIQKMWTARHAAYYAALALKTGSHGFTTDVCVPISQLAQVVVNTKNDLLEHGLIGPIVGHVGDGNFHVILPVSSEADAENAKNFSDRLVLRALEAFGTCTGEHGIGIGKMKYLEKELSVEGVNLMKSIKKAMDPNNILNPGKVINL